MLKDKNVFLAKKKIKKRCKQNFERSCKLSRGKAKYNVENNQ